LASRRYIVYLYLIVVVDSRDNNKGAITYSGMTPELRGIVDNAISDHGLDERVGFVVLDFTQPMDHEPLTIGSAGGHLRRLAREVTQPIELTRWVAGLSRADAV
jgi:hypothetical protein